MKATRDVRFVLMMSGCALAPLLFVALCQNAPAPVQPNAGQGAGFPTGVRAWVNGNSVVSNLGALPLKKTNCLAAMQKEMGALLEAYPACQSYKVRCLFLKARPQTVLVAGREQVVYKTAYPEATYDRASETYHFTVDVVSNSGLSATMPPEKFIESARKANPHTSRWDWWGAQPGATIRP